MDTWLLLRKYFTEMLLKLHTYGKHLFTHLIITTKISCPKCTSITSIQFTVFIQAHLQCIPLTLQHSLSKLKSFFFFQVRFSTEHVRKICSYV